MILDDLNLRNELKIKLVLSKNKPKDLIDEFGICGGKSIADLVAVYSGLHCFEIKSELDTLSRLDKQVSYYDKCFDKVTLLTTKKHIRKSFDIIPDWWGVIEAYFDDGIHFKYHRKAKSIYSTLDTDYILKSLWKDELREMYFEFNKKQPPINYTKHQLISVISKERKRIVYKSFSNILVGRNYRKSFFINEK